MGILFIKVVQEASTQPTLTLNPATINLNAYPFSPKVSDTFMLSGENLTAGDYNLNVPTVDGLTVSPTASATSSSPSLMSLQRTPRLPQPQFPQL